ncbi:MAG: YicC family protein [Oscillospiraceae bacterium]|nr:YicC family protein [Oscillospiraceae bacterium]
MTGYGSAVGPVEGLETTVELRSVNNRFLDCSVRLPRSLLFAETVVKEAVSAAVARGKVDVLITCKASQSGDSVVLVNRELAREYAEAISSIGAELGLSTDMTAASIARMPDVLTVERRELDKDMASAALRELTVRAAEDFNAMRAREGERLGRDMLQKLNTIEEYVTQVETRSPETVKEYRERLETRLREILEDRSIDEQRILTEAAIFADRVAVDEETVRLRSHIAQFRSMLAQGSPVGRKMDFLVQEFNREANTIGSKCSDAALSRVVVELKSEIEKVREQLQNVE